MHTLHVRSRLDRNVTWPRRKILGVEFFLVLLLPPLIYHSLLYLLSLLCFLFALICTHPCCEFEFHKIANRKKSQPQKKPTAKKPQKKDPQKNSPTAKAHTSRRPRRIIDRERE